MRMKVLAFVSLCVVAWAVIYGVFLHAEATTEMQLFRSGNQRLWWIIVLIYWIVDSAVVLCFAYLVRRPFGYRMAPDFPFFQFGLDVVVLVFLVHLAWLCTDHFLSPALASVGLGVLPPFLIIIAFAWIAVSAIRYRSLSRRLADSGPHQPNA